MSWSKKGATPPPKSATPNLYLLSSARSTARSAASSVQGRAQAPQRASGRGRRTWPRRPWRRPVQLAVLYFENWNIRNHRSRWPSLFRRLNEVQQNGAKWEPYLSVHGDYIVATLEAAVLARKGGVTIEQLNGIRAANAKIKIAKSTEAINKNANDAAAYKDRALAYQENNRYDLALSDLNEAVRFSIRSTPVIEICAAQSSGCRP